MRFNGLRWRHELKKRVAKDPNLHNVLRWIQHHPSSMEEPTKTLAEMVSALKDLSWHEAELLMDMGDGNMLMPIAMFEHYVYPMTYLRTYLEDMNEEKPAGGMNRVRVSVLILHATPSTAT